LVIDDEASMASGDERVVEHQLTTISSPHDGDPDRELEVALILKTQPDARARALTPECRGAQRARWHAASFSTSDLFMPLQSRTSLAPERL
jgi:hypothetical protein